MSKPFNVDEKDIQHYVLPEVTGKIVGYEGEVQLQTVEELEELQKQAFEEGKAEGYEAGRKQGMEELEKNIQEMKQNAMRLAKVFDFLSKPFEDLDDQVEHQLTELTVSLTRLLLKKEAALSAEHISNLIHDTLAYLPMNTRNIVVKLNPADVELMRMADIDIEAQDWKCIPDASITQGGCLIDSEASFIDASVEARLEQIVEQLFEQHPKSEEDV